MCLKFSKTLILGRREYVYKGDFDQTVEIGAISMLYKGDFDQTAEIGGHQGSQSPKGLIKEYLINNHISTHLIFLLELLK